jgi:CO dehydrogenase/acetyl-CoA synthase alpha subunit
VAVSSPGPAYPDRGPGEVTARAESARRVPGPGRCGLCPRLGKVNRLDNQRGLCAIGRQAVVASHFAGVSKNHAMNTAKASTLLDALLSHRGERVGR